MKLIWALVLAIAAAIVAFPAKSEDKKLDPGTQLRLRQITENYERIQGYLQKGDQVSADRVQLIEVLQDLNYQLSRLRMDMKRGWKEER